LLHAAQVAQSLFANVGDEGDCAGGLYVRFVERADDAEHHGEAAAIVANARAFEDVAFHGDADVGAFGKDGIKVRGEDQVRMRGFARPDSDHVAGGVRADIVQPEAFKEALQLLAAHFLFERRRRNLADLDLLLDHRRLIAPGGIESGADRRITH
jgi:hypothetical protein